MLNDTRQALDQTAQKWNHFWADNLIHFKELEQPAFK
jgi:hypothetical protein